MPVPERIRWAVSLVDPQPGERILEIGCGSGVAASLLGDADVTGIDRSAVAISRASKRGGGRFVQVDLAGFPAPPDSFDKAFAVNVNVFWTSDAVAECSVLARILRPGGVVHLVYDSPSARGAPTVAANLTHHGFTPSVTTTATLTCITGRLP